MVPFPFNHPKHAIPLSIWFANTLALAGLQAFAVLAAHLMRRESLAREALARANRELLATRELAILGSRAAERLHIARELHDVLGHHSQRAVPQSGGGRPRAPARAARRRRGPLDTARALTRTTLAEVRAVVSRLRQDDATDLSAALAALAAAIPHPRIHLRVPEALPPVDAERARAILRCAQECVTNAIRHAGAENLWIELDASTAASTCGSGTTATARRPWPKATASRACASACSRSGPPAASFPARPASRPAYGCREAADPDPPRRRPDDRPRGTREPSRLCARTSRSRARRPTARRRSRRRDGLPPDVSCSTSGCRRRTASRSSRSSRARGPPAADAHPDHLRRRRAAARGAEAGARGFLLKDVTFERLTERDPDGRGGRTPDPARP